MHLAPKVYVALIALSASAAADPPSAKVAAARCDEPALILTEAPLAGAAKAFHAACPAAKAPDFQSCRLVAYERAAIAAAHGFLAKRSPFQALFTAKPWFEANASYKLASLSPVEVANRKALDARERECKKPSAADTARVKKWLAGLPKLSAVPAETYVTDGDAAKERKASASELQAVLLTATAGKTKLALAEELAGPYVALEQEYVLAGQLDDQVPSVSKLAAQPDRRMLVVSFSGGFGADGKLVHDTPTPEPTGADTGTAMALDEGKMGKKPGDPVDVASVAVVLAFVYDAKDNLIALGAYRLVMPF